MLSTTKVARKEIARGQLLINGQWRDSETGETMPTTGPTIEAVITQVAKATSADADAAVKAAHRAFENGPGGACITSSAPRFSSRWPT
jgi:hypothetical protein